MCWEAVVREKGGCPFVSDTPTRDSQQLHSPTNRFHRRSLLEITTLCQTFPPNLGEPTNWMGVFKDETEKLTLEPWCVISEIGHFSAEKAVIAFR